MSEDSAIDIIVTTCGRLDYLKRTISRIIEATSSPYRLHIVDDGSDKEQKDYIYSLLDDGSVYGIMMRSEREGAMSAINIGSWMGFSDPLVFTDDDVLCPILSPDWLHRGAEAMRKHRDFALICLQHPEAKYKPIADFGDVMQCKSVGGTFLFTRREFTRKYPFPHRLGNLSRPLEPRCAVAHQTDWKIGYLKDVYCYHFGENSILTGKEYKGRFIQPSSWDTLQP